MGLKDFEFLKVVGKGGFGKIYRVRKKTGDDINNIYALKRVIIKEMEYVTVEKNILSRIKHPFVIELIDSFQGKRRAYFVLPYLSGGSLSDLLKKEGKLKESAALFYMQEIVVALEYLHSQGIIHRDIKPCNILLDDTGHIKIIDFGLSLENFSKDKLCYDTYGTQNYMAPEIIEKTGYGFSVDWYALGVLFYKMVVGTYPVHHQCTNVLLKFIGSTISFFPEYYLSINAKSLIKRLLEKDPTKRLGYTGANDIKTHSYFKNTCWNKVTQRLENPPFVP